MRADHSLCCCVYLLSADAARRLYPTCPWELKAAKRMILERKIAPRFPGREAKESCFTQECPICFMVRLFAFV